jgi:predicted nucleic acid-binding protein
MADYLIDTNILILAFRKRAAAVHLLKKLKEQGAVRISVITRTEIFAGMHPSEEERTLELVSALDTVAVDRDAADQAGRWIYQYARQGVQISVPDALIGASAVRHGLILVTTNASHFPIPEIMLQTANI